MTQGNEEPYIHKCIIMVPKAASSEIQETSDTVTAELEISPGNYENALKELSREREACQTSDK